MPYDLISPYRPRIWNLPQCSPSAAEQLGRELGLPNLIARLLIARGFSTAASVAAFLDPVLASLHDPLLLRDMDRAVDRVLAALQNSEPIAIYGDYDADGLTATALLTRFFRWLKVEPLSYVPNRLSEGYGISREGLDFLKENGIRLIITVDNGVTNLEEIAYARSLGMDVVVTDHHQPGDSLPAAAAVVDPHRADCSYPFKGLSGVGVAFKLAHALAKALNVREVPGAPSADEARAFLKSLMDLVAVGTVADVMPLQGENRSIVHHGLKFMKDTVNPGLAAMAEIVGIEPGRAITSENIAFMFAPRLNAAGRTGRAADALDMLLADDPAQARQLARRLDDLNRERRDLEAKVLQSAFEQIEENPALLDTAVLVIAGERWHPGVIGIVAARLSDRYLRPSIVLRIEDNKARGSARSIEGFDLHGALRECQIPAEYLGILDDFGGHKMAAGLTLRAEKIPELRRALHEYVLRVLPEGIVPRLRIDAEARIDEINPRAVEHIERLRPFGQDNPPPLIAVLDCELSVPPAEVKGKHLRLSLVRPGANGQRGPALGGIWFQYPENRPDLEALLKPGNRLDVAGNLRAGQWNGSATMEFLVKDIRAAEPR